jgi:hypothetical protein
MIGSTATPFLFGLITAGFLVAGAFFFHYWHRTNDSLFRAFGVAFWLMAANQALSAFAASIAGETSIVYLLRLGAFTVIAGAILRKNWRSRAGTGR